MDAKHQYLKIPFCSKSYIASIVAFDVAMCYDISILLKHRKNYVIGIVVQYSIMTDIMYVNCIPLWRSCIQEDLRLVSIQRQGVIRKISRRFEAARLCVRTTYRFDNWHAPRQ